LSSKVGKKHGKDIKIVFWGELPLCDVWKGKVERTPRSK